MTSVRLRRSGAAATVVLLLGLVVPAVIVPAEHGDTLGLFPPDLGASVAFGLVGAFLLARGAVANIAVVMCLQGVGAAATTATGVWRTAAAEHGPLHGAASWAAWVNGFVWLPGVALLVPLALLFPDGRLVSRVWAWPIRITAALAGVFLVVSVVGRTSVMDGRPYAFAPNPTGFVPITGALQLFVDAIGSVIVFGFAAMLAVSFVGVVRRRRRAEGVERAQLTCLSCGVAVTVVLLVGGNFLPGGWWSFVLELFAIALIPVAVGVAVRRYRLYDIDRIASRAVTYTGVLVLLAAVYVGVLAGVAALVPRAYGQVGVAAATLAVSVLAVPLTRRLRRVVDHRFDRRHYDAERVVAGFAVRLRARPERGDIESDLMDVLERTVQPAHAAVWVWTA